MLEVNTLMTVSRFRRVRDRSETWAVAVVRMVDT